MAIYNKDVVYLNLDEETNPYIIGDNLPSRIVIDAGSQNREVILENPTTIGDFKEIITISTTFDVTLIEDGVGGATLVTLNTALPVAKLISDNNASQWIIY